MSALTKNRNTFRLEGDIRSDPVAAGIRIFAGAIICLDASGNAVPGKTAIGLNPRGVCEARINNIDGEAGEVSVKSRVGTFRFLNHSSDLVGRGHIGRLAYIVDDQTVAASDGGSTRSSLGIVQNVTASGDVEIKIS